MCTLYKNLSAPQKIRLIHGKLEKLWKKPKPTWLRSLRFLRHGSENGRVFTPLEPPSVKLHVQSGVILHLQLQSLGLPVKKS